MYHYIGKTVKSIGDRKKSAGLNSVTWNSPVVACLNTSVDGSTAILKMSFYTKESDLHGIIQ